MPVDFSKVNRLPSLPVVAVRLLERFNDPDVALPAIVKIIQPDPAMTAKLLRASNSALYGAGGQVTTLNRAVSLLGKKTVTSLALCFSLSEESMGRGPFAALYKSIWLQSVVQATTAEWIARRFDRGMEGEYFAAALLSNIGRLAMLKGSPQEYSAVLERAKNDPTSLVAAEDQAFGTNHQKLTAKLIEHWGLPSRFQAALASSTLPVDKLQKLSPQDSPRLSCAVALAAAVGNYFCQDSRGVALARVTDIASTIYGMSAKDAQEFLCTVQQRVAEAADLFETDASKLGSPTEIMAEAMEQLAHLATLSEGSELDESTRGHLVDENGKLKRRIRELLLRSSVDPLTDVFNRGYFDEQFVVRIAAAQQSNQPLGLLFVDADHFKQINDQYGHAAGDIALKHLAAVLMSMVRADDLVARYGGEEFVVILANPSLPALESLGERIRSAVEQERIAVERGMLRITLSVGGAFVEPPVEESDCLRILATADAALYSAKEAGRNRVEVRTYRRTPVELTDTVVDHCVPEPLTIES